ncbi:TSUP family transporter [Streptomyces noursei]|uniref:TSUP family transporter n=1 Tax=Streptomyces noursei TaxID=1971 RepID=UPI002155F7F9|nr:TSUP family transporter [Streptomyces noursei]
MTHTDLWAPLDWPGFGGVTLAALLFLCVTPLLAGAVDAIVGGGGLLQLPAMLLVNPGGAVVHSLATSKMVGLVGTSAAVVTFARKTPLDWKAVGQMAATTFPASVAGAAVASALPKSVLNTVVLCALVIVGLHT